MWQLRRMGRAHGGGPLFFADDNDGGGSGGGGGTAKLTDAELEAAIRRLADRNRTDAGGVATLLYQENHTLREQVRQMKDAAVAVPKGGIVLTKEQAEAWEKYQKLGKVEDLEKLGTENSTLKAAVEKRDRVDLARSAAELVAYKPTVLSDLMETKGLHLELHDVEVEKNGKTEKAKVPFVRQRGNDGKPTGDKVKLTEYVDQHLADYKPALVASGQPQGGGIILPPQHGGGQGTGSSDAVGAFMEKQKKAQETASNPLLSPQTK